MLKSKIIVICSWTLYASQFIFYFPCETKSRYRKDLLNVGRSKLLGREEAISVRVQKLEPISNLKEEFDLLMLVVPSETRQDMSNIECDMQDEATLGTSLRSDIEWNKILLRGYTRTKFQLPKIWNIWTLLLTLHHDVIRVEKTSAAKTQRLLASPRDHNQCLFHIFFW